MFRDRKDAGQKLASELEAKYPKIKNGVVLALPRGGVVIGSEVAKALNLPLDIIVTRKIGAPLNPEYAIAAVSEHEMIVSPRENPDLNYVNKEAEKERREIQRRAKEYRGQKPKIDLKNQTVILVDDGLATGLTMEVALREVRQKNPRQIILAVPVAPPETVENFKRIVDDIIVLNIEPLFFAVGQFYEDFVAVSDKQVKEYLRDF